MRIQRIFLHGSKIYRLHDFQYLKWFTYVFGMRWKHNKVVFINISSQEFIDGNKKSEISSVCFRLIL